MIVAMAYSDMHVKITQQLSILHPHITVDRKTCTEAEVYKMCSNACSLAAPGCPAESPEYLILYSCVSKVVLDTKLEF